jgi:hypothetical protein
MPSLKVINFNVNNKLILSINTKFINKNRKINLNKM